MSSATPAVTSRDARATGFAGLASTLPASVDDDLDGAFDRIAALMYDLSGVKLSDRKKGLVRSRLAKRVRALGLTGYRDYADLVEGEGDRERALMVDLLTTNKTSFFREAAHFDFLRDHVVPSLDRPDRYRVWSAGCSTGEEPYTLSLVLGEALPQGCDLRILATDISSRVLATAREAVYPRERFEPVPAAERSRLVEPESPGSGRLRIRAGIRERVALARLNLRGPWPMRGPFDAVFCRNVMIYFDLETRTELVRRFTDILAPGGYLFVGHSESLNALDHDLAYVRPAVYRK